MFYLIENMHLIDIVFLFDISDINSILNWC